LVFEKDQNNEREARLKSWVLNHQEARESIGKIIVIDEFPLDLLKMWGLS